MEIPILSSYLLIAWDVLLSAVKNIRHGLVFTEGVFHLSSIVSKNGYSKKEVLEFAAYAENHSSHPIAQFIIQAYSGKIDESRIENYQEVAGHGIKAIVKGRNVLVGEKNYRCFKYFVSFI